MKNRTAIFLTALVSALTFSGCENLLGDQSSTSESNSQQTVEQHFPKRFGYTFTEVTVSQTATLTDLQAYIPFQYKDTIDSIDGFKQVIKDNLRTYSVVKQTENGTVKMYAAPTIERIIIESADVCKIRIEEEETTCSYSLADNGYAVDIDGESVFFEQKDFQLSYTVMFDETYGFGVTHYYEATL